MMDCMRYLHTVYACALCWNDWSQSPRQKRFVPKSSFSYALRLRLALEGFVPEPSAETMCPRVMWTHALCLRPALKRFVPEPSAETICPRFMFSHALCLRLVLKRLVPAQKIRRSTWYHPVETQRVLVARSHWQWKKKWQAFVRPSGRPGGQPSPLRDSILESLIDLGT